MGRGNDSKSEFSLEHPSLHPVQFFCREFLVLNCWVSVCNFSREYLPHQSLSYKDSCSLLYLFINPYIRILSFPEAVESDFFCTVGR